MKSGRAAASAMARSGSYLLVLGLVAAAIFFGSDLFSPVRFDREKIEVWATDGQIQVRGLYHYVNRFPLPVSFSLGLPFPVDRDHPAPTLFSISQVTSTGAVLEEIPARHRWGSIVFRIWFWPRQERWIRVDYLQKSRGENGRYILLTTRKWGQPLDSGDYILHLASGMELASSNYDLQPAAARSYSEYSFKRFSFYPDKDWVFSWRPSDTLHASREKLQ